MNYYSWRILTYLIMIVISLLIYKKIVKHNLKKAKIIYLIVMLTALFLLLMIPFESQIIKFDNLAEAFKYRYPCQKIIEKIETDDYAFITYGNDEKNAHYTSYIKDNGEWILTSPSMSNKKIKFFEDTTIILIEIKKIKVAFIKINYIDELDSYINVNDSKKSVFNYNTIKLSEKIKRHSISVVVENIDGNYYLEINGKKIYLDEI